MRPEMYILYNARGLNRKYYIKIVFVIHELEVQQLHIEQTIRKKIKIKHF